MSICSSPATINKPLILNNKDFVIRECLPEAVVYPWLLNRQSYTFTSKSLRDSKIRTPKKPYENGVTALKKKACKTYKKAMISHPLRSVLRKSFGLQSEK